MATTGWKYPGTAANVDNSGGQAWTNVDYAKADDSNYANNSGVKGGLEDWLTLTNFGFTADDVPSGATIDGIELIINRYAANANSVNDSGLYLLDSTGTQVGNNKASATKWPTSLGDATYGGSADTWGAGLDQADIVSSSFGIRLSPTAAASNNHYVDYVKIRITYTASGGASGPTNLKTYNTNTLANIKTINTNPIANVKTLNTNA